MTPEQRTAIEFIIQNQVEEEFTLSRFKEYRDSFDILHDNVDENLREWRRNYRIVIEYLKEQVS